jgi:hypothetical protein
MLSAPTFLHELLPAWGGYCGPTMISSGLKNSLIGYGDVVVGQTIEIWNIRLEHRTWLQKCSGRINLISDSEVEVELKLVRKIFREGW